MKLLTLLLGMVLLSSCLRVPEPEDRLRETFTIYVQLEDSIPKFEVEEITYDDDVLLYVTKDGTRYATTKKFIVTRQSNK